MPASLNPVDTSANIAAWQHYALAAAAAEQPAPGVLPSRLEWTQVPGLGPDEEILGDIQGRTILELGCGTGQSAALLASRGAHVVAIDAAPAQIRRARTRWDHITGVTFLCAEARNYLNRPGPSPDIILSIFGALDFTAPGVLLPLIAARLASSGLLAVSTVHPDWQPPQILSLDHTSRSLPLSRPLPDPKWWSNALPAHGLTITINQAVTAPGENTPRCLILTATKGQTRAASTPYDPGGKSAPATPRASSVGVEDPS